ncbi:DUF3124 domain-containing protein [Cytophagaceae bacterium DM2B3-1]|uniref:DUF3124 domain-containing protein n=1 Tax=Xanthocytophaga flava TaxID=3048013 RepID=A0ABT7CU10_9BACT|nr:DUF3124 domain-containing protein [Xanthocytophaga flavus]MDJ1472202.1 DUF3124 domain-containing protein [Xanthocytophaga flavus]MDJ1496986.1 DUF3124 domain-containing protein [Xanthocytophaga flavus]
MKNRVLADHIWTLGICLVLFVQCKQEKKFTGHKTVREYTTAQIKFDTLTYQEKVYVPTYSEIYHNAEDQYFPLLTSLSIRNTSLTENMYVNAVDYYDTEGKQLKKYLEKSIVLRPLQSVEFPVTHNDKGGAGANFIVTWGCAANMIPVIQAVMIGSAYQQGISFVTEGVVIEKKGL